jgi:hypothetical protein
MPNWCDNRLSIHGDAEQMKLFREWLGDTPLTLERINPLPEELRDTISPTPKSQEEKAKELIAKYGAPNWYDWRCDNWGTKWDVEVDEVDSTENDLVYFFNSAWAPPEKAIETLSLRFPKLFFRLYYCELGCAFAGWDNYEDGLVAGEYFSAEKDEAAYKKFVSEHFGIEFEEDEDEETEEASNQTNQN